MTFTSVVTSHANPEGLTHMLGQLRYQTRHPDETLVYHSGTDPAAIARIQEWFPEAHFYLDNDRQDWGHHKRSIGMQAATGDYVGFFNDDDSYRSTYIEKMMKLAEEVGLDVVYCNWNSHPNCGFSLGSSTSGNYIFRRSVGLEAGYKERCYEADGIFIDALRCQTDRIAKVGEILYFHNEGLRS